MVVQQLPANYCQPVFDAVDCPSLSFAGGCWRHCFVAIQAECSAAYSGTSFHCSARYADFADFVSASFGYAAGQTTAADASFGDADPDDWWVLDRQKLRSIEAAS